MKISLAVAAAVGIVLTLGPSLAGPGEPPQVTICRFPEMDEVFSGFSVLETEGFSLFAEVTGDSPMVHRWVSNGDSIGNGVLPLDYFYLDPGQYEVRFEATDAEGDIGTDTCVVDVIRLAAESDVWGRTKALYQD